MMSSKMDGGSSKYPVGLLSAPPLFYLKTSVVKSLTLFRPYNLTFSCSGEFRRVVGLRRLLICLSFNSSPIIFFYMEFWGIEVKPGQTVKCVPGDERLLHLSQASLGEVKKDKGSENVPIFVNINNQKLVLGTLSGDSCAQIQYDLVFEKDFELSHDSKNTSVFFVGYKSFHQDFESEDDFYDSDSEDELQINQKTNGKAVVKNEPSKPNSGRVNVGKTDESSKAKAQPGKPENDGKPKAEGKVEEDDDDDDDEEDSDDDNDDEKMAAAMMEGDDEDESSEEDEDATPKAENDKKRSAGGGSKSPILGKKAKVVTPTGKQKAGGDGKKGGHVATPHPAKQAGKTPATGDKPKQQEAPKSAGSIACKSCSKTFNSDNALQAHTKAKHSGAK